MTHGRIPEPARGVVGGGRYELGSLLGDGGVGEVYEAVDKASGRRVAVKLLKSQLCRQADVLERFEREARAAAALAHPNIVAILDFVDDGREPPVIVMERMTGDTVDGAVTRDGPMPSDRVARVASDMLSGLDAAHRACVVHRDIKPSNVFLTKDERGRERAKLIDFGIAKVEEHHLTSTGVLIGTPAYMAPEQVHGEPVDARADLYAVGATMYFMLAGADPFKSRSIAALLNAIAKGDRASLLERRPDADPALAEIVDRAMAVSPASRYGSASEMKAAIEGWLERRATTTRRAPTPDVPHTRRSEPPPPRTPPRSRANLPVAAGIATALLVGAGAVAAALVVARAGADAPAEAPSASTPATPPAALPAERDAPSSIPAVSGAPPSPAVSGEAAPQPRPLHTKAAGGHAAVLPDAPTQTAVPAPPAAPPAPPGPPSPPVVDAGAAPAAATRLTSAVVGEATGYSNKAALDALVGRALPTLRACVTPGDLRSVRQRRAAISYGVDPLTGKVSTQQDVRPREFGLTPGGRCVDRTLREINFGPADLEARTVRTTVNIWLGFE